eukprot:TRINITY_DN8427_c0_g1_i1.p1 TRINITY_DN8427_c0_g1~~TRINITY_DN8427_c0_g1_i1.p1  ORF type:complete len:333 (+),score=71.99 TRINITY_DN8427_c0_g1_i1:434-1432(+)
MPSETSIGFSINSLQRPFHLFAYTEKKKIEFLYAFSAINIIPERPSFTDYEKLYLNHFKPRVLAQVKENVQSKAVQGMSALGEEDSKNERKEIEKPCPIKRPAKRSKQCYIKEAPKATAKNIIESKDIHLAVKTETSNKKDLLIKEDIKSSEQRKVVIDLEEANKTEAKKANKHKAQVPTIISRHHDRSKTKASISTHSELLTDFPRKEMEIIATMVLTKAESKVCKRLIKADPLEDNAEDFERLVLGKSEVENNKPAKKALDPRRRLRRRIGKREDQKAIESIPTGDAIAINHTEISKNSNSNTLIEKTEDVIETKVNIEMQKQDAFEEVW